MGMCLTVRVDIKEILFILPWEPLFLWQPRCKFHIEIIEKHIESRASKLNVYANQFYENIMTLCFDYCTVVILSDSTVYEEKTVTRR